MIFKLKEGCLINTNGIKTVTVHCPVEGYFKIKISYYDNKKNSDAYISCEDELEAKTLIDMIENKIKHTYALKQKTKPL